MRRKYIKVLTIALLAGFIGTLAFAAPNGKAKGKDRILSKITFIHHKKAYGKPPWAGGGKGNGGGKKKEEGYYEYIAKGAKWKTEEDFELNPNCNDSTATETIIIDAVVSGLDEWETAGGTAELNIFGDLYLNVEVNYNNGDYRDYNTISFGTYENPDVIGVTTVWGYFTGPPGQREIIEAHILFNDDFVWGDAETNSALMDIQNIFTHELGHAAGMGDLYQDAASKETMYGYSSEGETKKRTLYEGDKTGITKLYSD